MKRTYVIRDGELVEKRPESRAACPYVIPDLPDYESPIDGSVVHGRSGRREDFKRTACRPYEGREQEEKEAARTRGYDDQKLERRIDESAHRAYAQLHPDKQRILRG